MNLNLASLVVRASDGTLDLQATLDAIAPEVVSLVEKMDNEYAEVASAVHAVFDQWKGTRLNTDAVISFSMQHLAAPTPDAVNKLTGKIKDYLKDNAGARGESLFWTRRGKGGGIKRWSDTAEGEELKDK